MNQKRRLIEKTINLEDHAVSGFHVRLNRGIEAKDLNCVLFSEEIANIDNRIKVVHAFNIHNIFITCNRGLPISYEAL